jgi:archaellum component FlaC
MASSASAQSSDHPLRPHSRRGSNVARKLKTIVDVAEEFATDSDIKAVVGLIDQTLGLQHSLKQKSEDLETLEKVIRESKARFETSSQDSLAIYETAKEKLELELKSCKDEVAALTDEVERKLHDVELLKGSEAKLHSEVKRLQDTSRAQTEEASANSTKIKDLEGNLKISRDENVGLQTQLRQERDLHAQARSNNVNSKQRFDSLEKEYNRILQEWQLAQSLTVQLTEEDPEEL